MSGRRRTKVFPRRISNDDPNDRRKIISSILAYVSSIFNIGIILLIGFQTLIPTTLLLSSYFIISIAGYFFLKKRNWKSPAISAYAIFPTIINIILLLNFYISFGEHKETYRFQRSYYWMNQVNRIRSEPDRTMSTKIVLENNAYDRYYGIRFFLTPQNIGPTERITYTFKTGILGIRVMTSYSFFEH